MKSLKVFPKLMPECNQVSNNLFRNKVLNKVLLMSITSVMLSKHIILCHLFSSRLQSFLASRSFPVCQFFRWPKYWSFNFNINTSNEYSGLISYWIDWFDHLAVQGTLKSLLQHHSSKPSILWCSAFFIVQLSHPYMTTLEKP